MPPLLMSKVAPFVKLSEPPVRLVLPLPESAEHARPEPDGTREQVDLPFEMIREAGVNALIHRDYDIAGQKCQLVVNADTITIKSPGGPFAPITLEQMRNFTAPMKSRNPVLHYVLPGWAWLRSRDTV